MIITKTLESSLEMRRVLLGMKIFQSPVPPQSPSGFFTFAGISGRKKSEEKLDGQWLGSVVLVLFFIFFFRFLALLLLFPPNTLKHSGA